MYDFLFELTEYSENEGAQILCEAASLQSALTILCWQNGFKRKELRFIERMSVSRRRGLRSSARGTIS